MSTANSTQTAPDLRFQGDSGALRIEYFLLGLLLLTLLAAGASVPILINHYYSNAQQNLGILMPTPAPTQDETALLDNTVATTASQPARHDSQYNSAVAYDTLSQRFQSKATGTTIATAEPTHSAESEAPVVTRPKTSQQPTVIGPEPPDMTLAAASKPRVRKHTRPVAALDHSALKTRTPSARASDRFTWPLDRQNQRQHIDYPSHFQGVHIQTTPGQKVLAVADGEVIFSGRQNPVYGHLILVQHSDQLISVYAKNSNAKVVAGDKVRRGQELASTGFSPLHPKAGLYFEVRRKGKTQPPANYLQGLISREQQVTQVF